MSRFLQNRLRLASAIYNYLQTHKPELELNVNQVVDLMRPRQLYATDNGDLFGNWNTLTTPFYLVIDCHVAISNLLIDNPEADVDMKKMFTSVCGLFYTDKSDIFGSLEDDDGTEEVVIKDDQIQTPPMDPIPAMAAVHYGFVHLAYLRKLEPRYHFSYH